MRTSPTVPGETRVQQQGRSNDPGTPSATFSKRTGLAISALAVIATVITEAAEDVVGVILHALITDSLQGPVNAVSGSVTAREYTATLNRILNRPTVFPLPAPVARLALGEFAEEMLLSSIRVDSTKLTDSGYEFRYPELVGALRHLVEE